MRCVGVCAAALLCGLLTNGDQAELRARPADMATGNVKVTNFGYPSRWHRFRFVAQERGGVDGRGMLLHQRLDELGRSLRREERAPLRYVAVDGDEAWFTGPIIYDSEDPEPTRWFVIKVVDGGKPRAHADQVLWTRVQSEAEAMGYVVNRLDPPVLGEHRSGNLVVHAR